MSPKRVELALRRQQLEWRIAAQRQEVAQAVAGLAPLFAAADALQAGLRQIKAHPEWVAAALAVLVVVKPRTAWRWARRAFVAWRLGGRLRAFVEDTLAGHARARG